MRDALVAVLVVAMLAVAYAVERRLWPLVTCWRCGGVGQVQRWHRITWKPCPRCAGAGQRPRRWTR